MTEIQRYLAASGWLIAQLFISALMKSFLSGAGLSWGLGPRDVAVESTVHAGRAERASRNLPETFAVFTGLIACMIAAEKNGIVKSTGAAVYLFSRIAYFFIYVSGIRFYIRTLTWSISMIGLGMIAWALIR